MEEDVGTRNELKIVKFRRITIKFKNIENVCSDHQLIECS